MTRALNRRSNTQHIHAIVLGAMITHQLGMKMAQAIGAGIDRTCLSYEKLYEILSGSIIKIRHFHELVYFDPGPRHIKRHNRARKSTVDSGVLT